MNQLKSKKNIKIQKEEQIKSTTLDKNHENKLNEFAKNENTIIPKLTNEKKKLK